MALNAPHLNGTEPAPSYPSHTLIEQDLSQIQPGHHPHRARFKPRGGPMEGVGGSPDDPKNQKNKLNPMEFLLHLHRERRYLILSLGNFYMTLGNIIKNSINNYRTTIILAQRLSKTMILIWVVKEVQPPHTQA
ncbi:OLC1v1039147C2 [Oldenlandia corymbosa var. corymbosa]|nr:OLC1v1039147C2 [Oldenlandia corymbosa var. corymbosa]